MRNNYAELCVIMQLVVKDRMNLRLRDVSVSMPSTYIMASLASFVDPGVLTEKKCTGAQPH